jgi:basic membrane protein A
MHWRLKPSAAAAAALMLVASACSSSTATPTTSTASLKIGVVTDVGAVDDKNFNQYSFQGAQLGAKDISAAAPQVVVPKDASEYAADINNFVTGGYNIIVTVGFNLTADTTKAAKANPNIWFVGVDQAPICVDTTGAYDSAGKCLGDAATLLPKYYAISFQEDQSGYLAGMVAAAATTNGKVGAIGGINLVPGVVRYMQGYELGAKAIKSDVQVFEAYVSTSDFTKAFSDPASGQTFAQQFIATNGVDVLFQVAGKTGNGVLDAACSANIKAIGVDVDQYASYTNADKCIITSAEKRLSNAVEGAIKDISAGTAKGGNKLFDATNGGTGISAITNFTLPADVQTKINDAITAMKAGTLKTCPTNCGSAS